VDDDQTRSAKEMNWQTGQQKKWPSQKEFKRKTLFQPEHALPSLSSGTDQGIGCKRENRPMKWGLKRTQKAGS
jgi:hypothetical protein